ncbi:MAG: hypothetical protein ACRBBO_04410 [Cognatishimia sp.]|uniref:hypothetical protein n=1 Tax=Cognatishimia sp. 1_MG-2023 TaxID=3062642 RepID=UPI0026E1912D|nr:hypothetical protein [Cognatishimia sp. 1_MG-2023]MDO6728338.1 hypothetical protein [Cognatishimia sp. 1_MG-2023]
MAGMYGNSIDCLNVEESADVFFTRVGLIVAWLLFAANSVRIAVGAYIVFSGADLAASSRRYFGADTFAQEMDQSFAMLGVAIALGILAEISRKISYLKEPA